MNISGSLAAAGLTAGFTCYLIQLSGTSLDITSSVILWLGVAVGFGIGCFYERE